jgi:hypothetical protein
LNHGLPLSLCGVVRPGRPYVPLATFCSSAVTDAAGVAQVELAVLGATAVWRCAVPVLSYPVKGVPAFLLFFVGTAIQQSSLRGDSVVDGTGTSLPVGIFFVGVFCAGIVLISPGGLSATESERAEDETAAGPPALTLPALPPRPANGSNWANISVAAEIGLLERLP